MKLLLDIGNSSVNWASEKESIFLSHGSFAYDKNNFEDSLQENISLTKNISKVLVSNVAGLDIFNSLPVEESKKITEEHFTTIKLDEMLTMNRKTGFYEMINLMITKNTQI